MSHAGKCDGSAFIISLDDLSRIVTAISSKHHWTSLYFHVPLLLSVVVLMYCSPENGLRRVMIYSNMCLWALPPDTSDFSKWALPYTTAGDRSVSCSDHSHGSHTPTGHASVICWVPTTAFDTSLQEYTLNMYKSSDVPADMIWSASNFRVVTPVNI